LSRAHTFGDVPVGQPFWYENANGLVEIAVNQGNASQQLKLRLGSAVVLA
jgi:S-adenosylmethionine hydrolase